MSTDDEDTEIDAVWEHIAAPHPRDVIRREHGDILKGRPRDIALEEHEPEIEAQILRDLERYAAELQRPSAKNSGLSLT